MAKTNLHFYSRINLATALAEMQNANIITI